MLFCGRKWNRLKKPSTSAGSRFLGWRYELRRSGLPGLPVGTHRHDADGESVLKEGHSLPPLAVRSGFIEIEKENIMSNLIVQPNSASVRSLRLQRR